MSDIDVAVIVVSYKSAALAVDCLASLSAERADSRQRIRVVLVDNASGDIPHIRQAVDQRGWSDWVTLIPAARNGGFAFGNNLGIRAAYEHGAPSYVYLLNPDTEVRPGGIGALVEFLEAHPAVGIAGSSFETEDGTSWPFAFRFPGLLSEIEHGVQLGVLSRCLSPWIVARPMSPVAQRTDWVSGAAMLIRPAVFSAVGCLDENFFLYFEETEFCHRAARAGFDTWYVPQSRVMHMIGKSTQVDERSRYQRRLPGYWFDSRTRYFTSTHAGVQAALIDVAALAAGFVGLLKRKLLGRPATPCYLRDLLAHSVLLPKNRRIAPLKSYFPPA
jgi:hypothetical protein